MDSLKDKGYVMLPYIMEVKSTLINNEIVWYSNKWNSNKWKNMFLKIKHFFIKLECLKNHSLYKNKIINSNTCGLASNFKFYE